MFFPLSFHLWACRLIAMIIKICCLSSHFLFAEQAFYRYEKKNKFLIKMPGIDLHVNGSYDFSAILPFLYIFLACMSSLPVVWFLVISSNVLYEHQFFQLNVSIEKIKKEVTLYLLVHWCCILSTCHSHTHCSDEIPYLL